MPRIAFTPLSEVNWIIVLLLCSTTRLKNKDIASQQMHIFAPKCSRATLQSVRSAHFAYFTFSRFIVGHPPVHAPIQGHSYCPLVKSVRSSLTQILFLSGWDFYCSKGAACQISLVQSFPVSSKRGSAAWLRLISILRLLWDKSGMLGAAERSLLRGQALISKNEKSSLKKHILPTFGLCYTSCCIKKKWT